ncbi:hypothetical protein METP3_03452 [Methanosarcinales archaeon]|nr:hypothetical protein METP3_03452 [Methanosarcinales archaeon]
MFDEKGQMHTLEGVAAATIMLLVIVYAIDATSMTPLTSSTANVHVETELQVLGQDILGALDYAEPGYNSKLKNDVLEWNGKQYIWNGTKYMEKGNAVDQSNLNNNLTNYLNSTLISQGIAHSVELTYLTANGNTLFTQNMIYNGNPSDNAMIVSRKIVLHNSDNPNKDNSLLIDIDPSTDFYNIVDVKLILWRM